MDRIKWCKKRIRIINPDENISKNYLKRADETLLSIKEVKSKEWKIIMSYYACYNALYSIFAKAGIKCEIHKCTIELMKIFDFEKEQIDFLKNLKQERINSQYYPENKVSLNKINKIKEFIILCKKKIEKADFEKIRKKLIN